MFSNGWNSNRQSFDFSFPVFVAGTRLATPEGLAADPRRPPIRSAKLVMTQDHGLEPIRWIGQTTCTAGRGRWRPFRIRAVRVGQGLSGARSPSGLGRSTGCCLAASGIAERMTGGGARSFCVAGAKKLLDLPGIDVARRPADRAPICT